MTNKGLYIHIPFCHQKCGYCSYVSFTPHASNIVRDYVFYLKKEMEIYSEICSSIEFSSVYFGGGTPTYLETDDLINLLNYTRENFRFVKNPEITVEVNPGTLEYNDILDLKKSGFNRLSIGVQSTDDEILLKSGRIHNTHDSERLINLAQRAGFDNLGVDLIYAFPGQSMDTWKKTLEKVVSWNVNHISAYQLKIDKEAAWFKECTDDKKILPDDEVTGEMYLSTRKFLAEAGFKHYEISNWSLPGYKSIHNMIYWLNNEYLGLGLGASSHLNGERLKNTDSIEVYMQSLSSGENPVSAQISLSEKDRIIETMIMGLRFISGIGKRDFKRRFGCQPEDIYKKEIDKLVSLELIENSSDRIYMTEKGLLLANLVMLEFV